MIFWMAARSGYLTLSDGVAEHEGWYVLAKPIVVAELASVCNYSCAWCRQALRLPTAVVRCR